MSKFFERNKRKSWLALLLLLLKGRRDIGLLLLMVSLLMFLFVLPANFSSVFAQKLSRLPGGSIFAAALGVSKPSFEDLLAAFRQARASSRSGGGITYGTIPQSGRASSIEMVRGSQKDLDFRDWTGRVGSNTTINGILTPQDAAKTSGGVVVPEQGRQGLVQNAVAAGLGAFAPSGFFNSAATRAGVSDPINESLSSTNVPPAGKVVAGTGRLSKQGAQRNPLAWSPLSSSLGRANAAGAVSGTCMRGGRCAFAQLTTGRANAMLARDPICTAGNSCPPEYAADKSGAIYDNNPLDPTIALITSGAASSQVDGMNGGTPNPPQAGTVNNYANEADQLQTEQQECQAADNSPVYGIGVQESLQGQIQVLSNDMTINLNCGGGSCSNAGGCQGDGNQMKSNCGLLNQARQSHYNACPLEQQNGPFVPYNC